MKIFITGVAGFLGSHLADELLKQGHHIVGVDNMVGGYQDNIPKGIDFHSVDCLNHDKMVVLMEDVDIVYHLACTAYEGLSVFSPHFVGLNTYAVTTSVLSAAIENKVKRFVFTSSMARYGDQQVPFTEDMEPKPQDPYGIAKVASEMVIKNLCEAHGMEWAIAVPHNIIGPRQRYDDPYRNVASIMINKMLKGEQPIIYGDGRQMRSFSDVKDVVTPLVKLGLESPSGTLVNVGPDDRFIEIDVLARTIAQLLEFDVKPIYVPERPKEVKLAACSSDLARKILGYEPTTVLEDSLQSIIDYVKTRGTLPFSYNMPLEIINNKTPKTWLNHEI